jgi:hypothetical protein
MLEDFHYSKSNARKGLRIITGHTHKTSEINICQKIYTRFRVQKDKLKIQTAVYIKNQTKIRAMNSFCTSIHTEKMCTLYHTKKRTA